jgi:CheY-like chemotaxis protein
MTMTRRILLVEDDVDVRDAVAETLADAGYEVSTASNGQAALEILRSGTTLPGLILLDLMMPVMDGWAFRDEQRRDPAISSLPVVALTAHGDVSALAVDGYLRKPIEPDELLDTLARFFSGSAART